MLKEILLEQELEQDLKWHVHGNYFFWLDIKQTV